MTVLVSAGVGVVASMLTAYVTAHLAARQEIQRWRKDLAEKYAALAVDRPAQAQALARQFAIGVLILETGRPEEREKIFVAPYTRIIAGRIDDNEIVLPFPSVSRRHFAISADGKCVYIEDLGSANGVRLNDSMVVGRSALKNGDIIRTGDDYNIEFQSLSTMQ